MKNFALLLVLATGCISDAPELTDLRCTPASLSAASAGPFTISCDASFTGAAGDASITARAADGSLWASDTAYIDADERDAGSFHFALSRPTAPPQGTLTIRMYVDHVDGIDGPAGDEITTQIQVVP